MNINFLIAGILIYLLIVLIAADRAPLAHEDPKRGFVYDEPRKKK